MEGAKQPFWEESYKRKGKLDTFGGGKPSQVVVDAAARIKLPAIFTWLYQQDL